jgi:hypothetical protein
MPVQVPSYPYLLDGRGDALPASNAHRNKPPAAALARYGPVEGLRVEDFQNMLRDQATSNGLIHELDGAHSLAGCLP